MKFFLIVSVMLVILLGGCAVNTASVEKEGKTNNTTEQKEYDSLDDYFKELTGDGVSISKPTFTIEGKKLNICFEVGYPQKVIDKLKNTKQMSYYQVIEEEGNGILAKYTKTIENTILFTCVIISGFNPNDSITSVFQLRLPSSNTPPIIDAAS